MMFCQSLPIKQISTLIILLFFYISCTHLPPRVDEFGRPQRDYTYQPPIQTGDGWEISTLKREGIDPEYLNRLMSLILQETYEDFHSILIVKDGKLVFEEYFSGNNRDTLHVMASATKSVTSILVGIAIDNKMISDVNRKAYEFLPQYKGTKWVDNKYEISLENMLTMTAGVEWLASTSGIPLSDPRNDLAGLYRSHDPIKYTLEKELIQQPGRRYDYNTGLTTVLGEILKNASGLKPDKFAAKYLLSPLGIQHYKWHVYPNGTIDTGGGLYLRSRDMAKIGYMMLMKGKWKGNQIVSEKWVDESTKAHMQQTSNIRNASHYGYQWHLGKCKISDQRIESFFAQGLGGQYIFVIPNLDLVVVFTFQHPYSSGWFNGNLVLAKYILPSVLPPSQTHKSSKVDIKDADKFVGKYELKRLNEQIDVGKKNGNLYFKAPHRSRVMLFPETESAFYATDKKLGEVQVSFIMDTQKNVTHFVLGIGFQSLHYEKIK